MNNGQAGPSVIPLEGTQPGVLDKSQRSRLLRHQSSVLSFASFDPYVATPRDQVDISNLSLDEERCRPKRIVIETVPGYGSFWRWVPSARKQEGVEGEGHFPRVLEVCGQLCECSQEQWDIYKLDPLYDCYVKIPPALTVVIPKASIPFTAPPPETGVTPQDSEYEEGDDDDERMLIDDEGAMPPPKVEVRFRMQKPSPREPLRFDFTGVPQSPPREPSQKRRAHVSFQSPDREENEFFADASRNRNTKLYEPKNQKRARTTSPNFGKRAVNAQRATHENRKKERMQQEIEARREMRDRRLLREVLSEVHQGSAQLNGNRHTPHTAGDDESPEENADAANEQETHDDHEARVAESLRKMAELNANRESERLREKQLGVQEDTRPNIKQAHQRRAEAERRRSEEQAIKKREAEEARLRDEKCQQRAELLARVERERQLRHDQWNRGSWTAVRAIERYKITCAFFDKANFSEGTLPLAFIDIPWPTLRHPALNRAQDVDWQSTNEFFDSLKPYLRDQAFKKFLRQSFQRFHPDRWSGRNLFSAILEEDERNEIETAVNTVSKALGALYADV